MYFICLPCRYVALRPEFLEYFLANGLHPELCLDAWSLQNKDNAWFEGLGNTLAQRGLSCSVHLTYENLHPGSHDRFILDATRLRLKTAFAMAQLLNPKLMVGHVDYSQDVYGEDRDGWLERHTETWADLLDGWPGHPPLYLENTFELEPEPVCDAVAALESRGAGICFDVSHWHCFSRGVDKQDLDKWVECFAPYLRHLHLHDNDGSSDQHVGMGQGAIPWDQFFALLQARNLTPSVTFEPHDEDSLRASLAFMQGHPEWFAPLIS